MLYKHFDKKVIILIDDYETPLVEASKHGYYRKMEDLMASMYGMEVDKLKAAVTEAETESIKGELKTKKALDFIAENAKA